MVNKENLLKTFIELCEICSPSFNERAVSDYISSRLAELGVKVRMDGTAGVIGGDTGNLIATIEGKDDFLPTLLFAVHMDTVEPSEGVKVKLDGDLITSAGETILGADDKVGIAALLEIARMLEEERINEGRVHLFFSVAEEVGLHGAKAFDLASLKTDYAFTLDAAGPVGAINVRSPYQESFRVEFLGRTAHAGVAPEQGVNAIQAASKAIASMKLGRLDEETTANVGVIEGGLASNIVPDRVRVSAEARSFNLTKLNRQVSEMKRLFEEGAREVGADVRLKVYREYDGYHHREDDPVVMVARRAMEKLGIEPRFSSSGGGSDANIFNSKGVPTANLGIGAEKVHTTEESASISSMVLLTELLVEIIKTARE
ncbi:MAG: M20/M25/M40 family metallo-hydrolase [Actinobacteria bacterium]|nr:M20/M25/M40 family metallo-hydrolase [Actinomycetota bacterium]